MDAARTPLDSKRFERLIKDGSWDAVDRLLDAVREIERRDDT